MFASSCSVVAWTTCATLKCSSTGWSTIENVLGTRVSTDSTVVLLYAPILTILSYRLSQLTFLLLLTLLQQRSAAQRRLITSPRWIKCINCVILMAIVLRIVLFFPLQIFRNAYIKAYFCSSAASQLIGLSVAKLLRVACLLSHSAYVMFLFFVFFRLHFFCKWNNKH